MNRGKSGIRDYQEEYCGWFEFVKGMRRAGLSIEVLIEYPRLFQRGDDTMGAGKEVLIGQRELLRVRLEEMQKTLERLDYRISRCDRFASGKGKLP